MDRVAVIGNCAGGKSVVGRLLAQRDRLPYFELDQYLLDENFGILPEFELHHAELIAGERWIIDGLGRPGSIPLRLARATRIILIDMPLWMHYTLAAERQTAWATRALAHPPGGILNPPRTAQLFHFMWQADREWLPDIRAHCAREEAAGKPLIRVASLSELNVLRLSMTDMADVAEAGCGKSSIATR